MRIRNFELERFFAKHEFSVKYVLGASDVDGMPMSEVLALADAECQRLWDGLVLGYSESAGHPLLRAEIAKQYSGLDAEDILVFAGAEEAIFVAMHAALDSGDHAVVVTPAYQSLYEIAGAIGANVTQVPLNASDWSLDVGRIAAALTPRTRLVVINFPHSPTGALIDRDQLGEIVSLCAARGIRLFSDEVYRLLEYDPGETLPPAATLDANALSLGVMSKAYGLAGTRIGWIATRDRAFRARMAALKDYTTICSSAPSELLALIGLRASTTLIARSRRIIETNLPILSGFIGRHSSVVAWAPPKAGSVAFPRFVQGLDAGRVADRFIAETGVLILPGGLFDYDRSHFRVGLGRANMPASLAAIEPLLQTLAD
ncbi:MAG TPA: aminotransferase class I/II-fold pyridoxal phosphate-dependent enzyme [Gemmatimonadaceae bacterium]